MNEKYIQIFNGYRGAYGVANIKNAYVNGPCIFPNSSYANVGLNTLAFTKLLAQKLKTILLNN